MEKSCSIKKLRIIFGDGFLQQLLITSLSITETCALRCDYYHQIEQIWPKKFGQSIMHSIGNTYDVYCYKTIQEWYEVYNQAVKIPEDNINSILILMAIHQNPSYYAGYYLKGVTDNMDVLGSITAEKIHAVNVRIIVKGSTILIVEKNLHCSPKINILQGIIERHVMNYMLVQLSTSHHTTSLLPRK